MDTESDRWLNGSQGVRFTPGQSCHYRVECAASGHAKSNCRRPSYRTDPVVHAHRQVRTLRGRGYREPTWYPRADPMAKSKSDSMHPRVGLHATDVINTTRNALSRYGNAPCCFPNTFGFHLKHRRFSLERDRAV